MEVEDRPSSAKLIIPMALLPLCATERRSYVFFLFLFFSRFLRLHPRHMDVPRPGVELELQLLAYVTATETAGSEAHL